MAYYNTCPLCGCNLDPGEKCDCEDCEDDKKELEEFYGHVIKTTPVIGQMTFVLDSKETDYEKKTAY